MARINQKFGVRWQAQRDTAFDPLVNCSFRRLAGTISHGAVVASLCRRTPKLTTALGPGYLLNDPTKLAKPKFFVRTQ